MTGKEIIIQGDHVDAAAARAAAAGGSVVAGPLDTAVGRMATIQDPHGATFSVITLNEWP